MDENLNVQPVTPHHQQEERKSGTKSLVIVLTSFGVIALIALVGAGAYLLGKNQGEKESSEIKTDYSTSDDSNSDNTSETEEDQEATNEVDDPYEGWKKYDLKMGYTVMIPQTWEVINDYEITQLTPTDKYTLATFKDPKIATGSNDFATGYVSVGTGWQSGDPGNIGGCDLNLGIISNLFDVDLLGKNNVMLKVYECYVDEELSYRSIKFTAENLVNGPLDSLSFAIDTNDVTSSISKMKSDYADVKLFLESFEVTE